MLSFQGKTSGGLPRAAIVMWVCMAAIAGCGGRYKSTDDPGEEPPHGGVLIVSPDRETIVEVVRKEGDDPLAGEVTFYIYSNGFAPFEPAPTSGVLALSDHEKIELVVSGDGLATPVGPALFRGKDLDGVLEVELDGEKARFPLALR
jgi:hypothetical protein